MIDKKQIENLVRQRDLSLTEAEIDKISNDLLDAITSRGFDFSNYEKETFTQQRKKRRIYRYEKLSCEDIICQYLKRHLDSVFQVDYPSRNKIMNIFFNILPSVKDMNDFVIVRADFKSFFDSVLSKHVYDQYIRDSLIKRHDKELLAKYIQEFKYCYAGLCLSNVMSEIICRDFDERIRARLADYGVVFYERYVDDFIIILNNYLPEEGVIEIMEDTIRDVFGKSPVKLAKEEDKFSYIAKRNIRIGNCELFSFLGYEFEINEKMKGRSSEIQFRYGITDRKLRKYTGIIERAFIQYTRDHDIELLRQRIKIYSARVVIGRTRGSSAYDWLTKGIVANYNELQHHMDDLLPKTESFLKSLYFNLMKKHGIDIPYFMIQSTSEESIYSLSSNMKRNRSIIFQDKIGVSINTLVKWIKRIDPAYSAYGKDYYCIVADYLEAIKIE